MATIYIESFSKPTADTLEVTLEALIALHVFKVCDNENVNLSVVLQKVKLTAQPLFQVQSSNIHYKFVEYEQVPCIAKYCTWPVVVVGNTVVAGLASISRQIIKNSNNEEAVSLLGFREACLMACNETSIWTKFCEVDMISTVKEVLRNPRKYIDATTVHVPIDLSRFESHMAQPVRLHNVYKLARIKNNDKLIKSSVPVDQLNLEHKYGEGPFVTLADLLLFPCFKIIFQIFEPRILAEDLPLSVLWFDNVREYLTELKINFNMSQVGAFETPPIGADAVIFQEQVLRQSLYAADPKRYKPQSRIYTRQNDVEKALTVITNLFQEDLTAEQPFGHNTKFSWDDVPLEANPLGGALPQSRANRKCQQLENLAKAVLGIPNSKCSSIVDFCSGSGHLGILIAALLPDSHVILVENKERSLLRAQERVTKLNLTNVSLVQSNLDYFVAEFDVGMALHACGVATDLVIQSCIKNKAHFVCCPCCYGGIHDCHHLTYPRSRVFRDTLLTYRDYLTIGHSADQTHDEVNAKTAQGFVCMNVIDTDRKLQAEECGYVVYLGKLFPPSCTPKNNLLVGLYESLNF